ncbi:MAG TPA: hypothetical protein PLA50_07460 [Bacteroidia bacterium]|nr:hypothetical protein [Bacteroidia bacterium]
MSLPAMPIRHAVSVFVALLLAVSCSQKESGTDGSLVSWPELTAFGEIASQAEALARTKDRAGLLQRRTTLLEAGWAVSPRTVPENVADRERVHQLMSDLSSLVNGFAQSDISDERLFGLAGGLRPAVEALIEAAGAAPVDLD